MPQKQGSERFVQISTDEVYGSLGSSGAFTEQSPIAPNSPYAASKASADLLVRSYCHTHGFPAIITRCSNNYGPYQFPEKLIPLLISNAMADVPLPIYGDGMNVRDWIHVRDHCAAIDAVLHHGKEGEVYNVGARQELPNLDVVHRILRALNKDESLITYVEDRPGHDRRYAIDSSKIGDAAEVAGPDSIRSRLAGNHRMVSRQFRVDGACAQRRVSHLLRSDVRAARPDSLGAMRPRSLDVLKSMHKFMKILVVGSRGMLGTDLMTAMSPSMK